MAFACVSQVEQRRRHQGLDSHNILSSTIVMPAEEVQEAGKANGKGAATRSTTAAAKYSTNAKATAARRAHLRYVHRNKALFLAHRGTLGQSGLRFWASLPVDVLNAQVRSIVTTRLAQVTALTFTPHCSPRLAHRCQLLSPTPSGVQLPPCLLP